jgi:hypothetical protein
LGGKAELILSGHINKKAPVIVRPNFMCGLPPPRTCVTATQIVVSRNKMASRIREAIFLYREIWSRRSDLN